MKSALRKLHAHRDTAVGITCAIGLAFVLLVIPQITDHPATARIKEVCEIESRRELDSDPHAMARFKGQLMQPYAAHCRQQGWSE